MLFTDILKNLIKSNNINQTALALSIGFTPQTISKWCNGKAEPDIKTIIKLANYFNVSIDYLLGNDKNNIKFENMEQEKSALKNALVRWGYMKTEERLTDSEIKAIMTFIKWNKIFIKKNQII